MKVRLLIWLAKSEHTEELLIYVHPRGKFGDADCTPVIRHLVKDTHGDHTSDSGIMGRLNAVSILFALDRNTYYELGILT